MKEDIDKLLALQEIDSEIAMLREKLNLYPPMKERIDKNLARKRKENEAFAEKLKKSQKMRRDFEKEIQFIQEQVNKKQQQQLTPKIKQDAYDALKHEIEAHQNEISKMEDKILELINGEEELEKTRKEAENRFKEEEDDARLERERIQGQIETKQKRLTELEKERQKRIAAVPQPLLQYYNRYFKAYGPNVVVRVEGGSCGGCHMRILPQVLVEIRRGDKIVHCEGCRRILIEQ